MQNWKTLKLIKPFLMIILVLSLTSCTKEDPVNTDNTQLNATFAVLSDPHYFKSSLGTSGKAFEEYLVGDRKLLAESQAISEAAIKALKSENIKFVLICGDLTKDGEKESHIAFAKLLGELKATGKKVIVVPGNHDVNNPHSVKFEGDNTVKIPSVSPEEFADIYKDYGFGQAIAKDPNSLSYVTEPVPGLWVFALDPCKYKDNTTSPIVGGKYSAATLEWINTNLEKAKKANKTVIGVQHHGLVEHFTMQKTNPISADYVIDDWKEVAEKFINGGMKAIFTGHFHAQDITKYTANGKDIYDIETGSLVTTPCPYRICTITNSSLNVATKYINSINYDTKGVDFQTYALNMLKDGMPATVVSVLTSMMHLPQGDAELIAPIAVRTFIDHYKGDEVMPADIQAFVEALAKKQDMNSIMLGSTIKYFYTDLAPADNNINLNIMGSVAKR